MRACVLACTFIHSGRYYGADTKCDESKATPAVTIKGYKRLPQNNYTALMNAVATVGPIAISAAAEPWQLYSRGIFDDHCGADVDHAIQLVGYGTCGWLAYVCACVCVRACVCACVRARGGAGRRTDRVRAVCSDRRHALRQC